MKKNVVRILTAVLMLSVVFSSSVFAAEKQKSAWESFVGLFTGNAVTVADTQVDGVTYRTHIQNDGWKQGWVSDGDMSGSEGRGLRLEGIEIEIEGDELPDGLGITYRTHIENDGWKQGWVSDGDMSGSEGRGLRLEGIEIMLTGENADDYTVLYRTHIENDGWKQGWVADGDMSGSEGRGLRLEGIEIKIEQVDADLTAYEAAKAAVAEADYTTSSWTAYQAVVAANPANATDVQSKVDEATANIVAAQANLVKLFKYTSISAINATSMTATYSRSVIAGDNYKQLVLLSPTNVEIIATTDAAIGSASGAYTFAQPLSETGTYTIKGTAVTAQYVTDITSLNAKLNADNSVLVTGSTILADSVQVSTDGGATYTGANLAADGTFAYTTPILTAGSKTITVKAIKGATTATESTTVNVPQPNQAAVVSATAVNPFEIKVVFNTEVEKTSAETVGNYTVLADTTLADAVPVKATLQADNKTVIVSITTELTDNMVYQVKKVEKVLTKANNQFMAVYNGTVQYFVNPSTNGPKLLSVAKTADNKFVLTFDKHVQSFSAIKIDNFNIAGPFVSTLPYSNGGLLQEAGVYTVTTPVQTNATILKAGVHPIVVTDAADMSTAPTLIPSQNRTFTITNDTAAPYVTTVSQYDFRTFDITFSEPIVSNIADLITANNFVVKKGGFTFTPTVGTATPNPNGYISVDRVGTTNTYRIVLNDAVFVDPLTYNLYDEGTSSTALALTVKGYKDAAGMIGSAYSSTVTLTKEAVAPYVLSSNLNTVTENVGFDVTALNIKFSETLKAGNAIPDVDVAKIKVYDKNNVNLPLTSAIVNASSDTLVLGFATPVDDAVAKQLYKVEIGAGAVKDLAGNKNTTATTYVDNRAGATPLVLNATPNGHGDPIASGAIGVDDNDKNIITVNFGANKMTDSAITAGNYRLDDAALPATSQLYFESNTAAGCVVKIVLPEQTYPETATGTLALSKSIVSEDGTKYVATATEGTVSVPVQLSDNIKPVLTGAKFVADEGTTSTAVFELSFSEGLAAITADDADNMDDFIVIINGAEYAVTAQTAVTAGDTKTRITIGTAVNTAQGVEIQVVPVGSKNAEMMTKDTATLADGTTLAGNLLTESTKVTVTGTVAV